MNKVIVGTRRSLLARRQTDLVISALSRVCPDIRFETCIVVTRGDRVIDKPLHALAGKGLFTREIEEHLLDGRIDLAVHSLKDLPTEDTPGLMLGAVCERESPHDVLVSTPGATLATLPAGSVIGTSSLRRRALLQRLRPDLPVVDLRGNIDTRLSRLDEGGVQAIVLAHAGLIRTGLQSRVSEVLDAPGWYHAVAQGALAIQMRTGDERIAALAGELDYLPTRQMVTAERAFLQAVQGGCQVPVGVRCGLDGEIIRLAAMVCSLDGRDMVESAATGCSTQAAALGAQVAHTLLDGGAAAILNKVRGQQASVNQ